MKAATLMFSILAALVIIFFAFQFISFYIAPSDLAIPDGLDQYEKFYWQMRTFWLEPATFLVTGIIALSALIAGIVGFKLSLNEKRVLLGRWLMVAAAGFSYFILIIPASYLYLASVLSTLRKTPKAIGELVQLILAYILVTFLLQNITGFLFSNTFLSKLSFEGAIHLTDNVPTAVTIIVSISLGALLCAYSSILLFKQQHSLIAFVFIIMTIGFLVMLTPISSAAELLPFIILIISLVALIINPGKNTEKTENILKEQ